MQSESEGLYGKTEMTVENGSSAELLEFALSKLHLVHTRLLVVLLVSEQLLDARKGKLNSFHGSITQHRS
jgi:hypothetical protein